VKSHFVTEYEALVADLLAKHSVDDAMALAAGGAQFAEVGRAIAFTLDYRGLTPDSYLIDVGCGPGRVALALRDRPSLRYLGTDVVHDLVDYARRIVDRSDWRFVVTDGLSIPEEDGAADFVLFSSVFTHLRAEESFTYLREAMRVLRPGGRIMFTFLEMGNRHAWQHMEYALAGIGSVQPMTAYIDPVAVPLWAEKLGCYVARIWRGEDSDQTGALLVKP
jgi:ubiquinone/menaquinone biosynthesis C-methylase UbiE